MTCDCDKRGTIVPPTKEKDCDCGTPKGGPGLAKIYVNKGNIARNRAQGWTGSLPAITIVQDGRTTFADRVELLGPSVIVQDDSAKPAVWIETTGEIVATLEGKKT